VQVQITEAEVAVRHEGVEIVRYPRTIELVRRGDNLLCFGLPGRGKSHLVAALGREWIQCHRLKVLFTRTFKLVTQLLAAKRDLKLPAALAKLDRFDVVILDDIGYVQQSREEMEVLFTFRKRPAGDPIGGRGQPL
jgi:DNA replication protein DnaC